MTQINNLIIRLTRTPVHLRLFIPTRKILTTSAKMAGFKGSHAFNPSHEQKQIMMARAKIRINRLQNQRLERKIIMDFKTPYSWQDPDRQRPAPMLSAEELERRILLQKEWNNFVTERKKEEDKKLLQLKQSQEKALYELRQESEELYNAALELDDNLFPFVIEGPSETPPNLNYVAPLGTCFEEEVS